MDWTHISTRTVIYNSLLFKCSTNIHIYPSEFYQTICRKKLDRLLFNKYIRIGAAKLSHMSYHAACGSSLSRPFGRFRSRTAAQAIASPITELEFLAPNVQMT